MVDSRGVVRVIRRETEEITVGRKEPSRLSIQEMIAIAIKKAAAVGIKYGK